jgi:hypothetical protein
MTDNTTTVPARDYEVKDRGIDYVVTIDNNHCVLSVTRLVPLDDCPNGSRPRRGIWHIGMLRTDATMSREVSRAIQAARIMAQGERQAAFSEMNACVARVIRDAIDGQPKNSTAERLANVVLIELSAAGYCIIRSEPGPAEL